MAEYQCHLIDSEGGRYAVQLVRSEGGAAPAQWRWFADITCIVPMPKLAEGMGVAIINEGYRFEAFILSVDDDNRGARIAGKGEPPWPGPGETVPLGP